MEDSINIREGVAFCSPCGELVRLSDVRFSDKSLEDILERPPKGCSVESHANQVVISVSMRSLGPFLGATAICIFWNSIVSVFLLQALAGVYFNLVGPVPNWFPAPGIEEGIPEINGGPMGPGDTIFLCLFLVPFVLIGAITLVVSLLNLLGSIVVVMDRYQSYVSTGFSIFRWWSKFDPHHIREVRIGKPNWNNEEGTQRNIEIIGMRTVRFGTYLDEQKREWLCLMLSMLLLERPRLSEELRMLRPDWLANEYRF